MVCTRISRGRMIAYAEVSKKISALEIPSSKSEILFVLENKFFVESVLRPTNERN